MSQFFRGGIKLWLILLGLTSLFACTSHSPPSSLAGLVTQAEPAQLGTGAALAADGNLHIVVREGEHLALYSSPDLGANWNAPTRINAEPEAISANGENRPKVALAKDGGLLVSWTHPLAKRFTGEIRLARSGDGRTFNEPFTVHRDRSEITHRFDSLLVTKSGDVLLVWIDKRDMEIAHAAGEEYRGAGIYAAVSTDHGRSFAPEFKLADHACECCRIAFEEDVDGSALVLWRHVFEPNERDHALLRLDPAQVPGPVQRATFDRWAIDACPHHGPGLAVADDGTRHSVWFNVREGEPQVFYGHLQSGEPEGQRSVGGSRAAHADVAVRGDLVTLVWNEFDGERTHLYTQTSSDGGKTFESVQSLSSTSGRVDQPRLAQQGDKLLVVWHTELAGVEVYSL
ncbi:hypothetical protein [Marinimicrobium sp. ABcell2]|uniref:hypothetical protein n=1 Tax=Marinimicrobium sp. ABcell2 TaxID=3069751 RepID=UPI0027B871A7|nr:hypothetical protein [Marinimicrobium sp. ABcell2]MDQ2078145.1 hypothetical protein [Marinimicrobium sp. ABcell2]